MNRVGAGAAALAGLHPLDFDPDDKWDFAAGMGIIKMLMQWLSERIIVLTKIRCSVWEVPLAEAKIW